VACCSFMRILPILTAALAGTHGRVGDSHQMTTATELGNCQVGRSEGSPIIAGSGGPEDRRLRARRVEGAPRSPRTVAAAYFLKHPRMSR
jgi:hypothetical protein